MNRGRPKKIVEEIFKGRCAFCSHLVKKNREEINIKINRFNEEYYFMNCPQCNGNMSVRLTIKDKINETE